MQAMLWRITNTISFGISGPAQFQEIGCSQDLPTRHMPITQQQKVKQRL